MKVADGRTVQIPIARAYMPLLRPSRYKGVFGGRGSAKSHEFADLLIDRAMTQPSVTGTGLRWVCVREFQKSLDQSVKLLLEDKIKKHALSDYFRIQHNQIGTPGDGLISFQGMQDHTASSIKSLEGYDGAWVEEAQTLSQRSLDLLRPTIRNPDSELWFSWNPRSPNDPVEFLRNDPPPDAIVLEVNYNENPFFPNVLRREMEYDKRRDPEKYAHVWLGAYERSAEARVFKNWTIQEFDEPPQDTIFYYGADWGFSIDPSTLVRIFFVGKQLYISHEAYRVGVEIDNLGALFDQVPGAREWPIIADSARPETISYMQRHGFPRMRAAIKGKNSVKEGIIFLQGFDIIVHPRCERTVIELTNYRYKVDPKTEHVLPILNDKENHIIDPLRYATEGLRNFDDGWVVA